MAKKQARVRATAKEWAGRVKRWERSGLTAAQFGEREGFSGRQLSWWKWHLGRSSPKTGAVKRAPKPKSKRDLHREVDFVPVKLPMALRSDAVEIVLGNGRVVRVPTGCDESWLAQVLAVAERGA